MRLLKTLIQFERHLAPKSLLLCGILFLGMDARATVPYGFTQQATLVTGTTAVLNGMATPNGADTMVWFNWGTTTAYGNSTGMTFVGNGDTVVLVTNQISGLSPLMPCHFRLVASNSSGITVAADSIFTYGKHVSTWGDNYATVPPNLTNVVALAAGNSHNLALKSDGTVCAWGYNSVGQTNVPSTISNIVAIAAGRDFSLVLNSAGIVSAWGANASTQTNVPSGLSNIIAISCANSYSMTLKNDGTVKIFGLSSTNVPAGLSNIVAIAAAGSHFLALKADGTVIPWGSNGKIQTNVPSGATNIIAIAAGDVHSLALKSDGTVFVWGSNPNGQLNMPSDVSNVVAIAGGDYHSIVLKNDGTTEAWGGGSAVASSGLSDITEIGARGQHNIALAAEQQPISVNQTNYGVPNQYLPIGLSATDANDDTLNFKITAFPTTGTLYQNNNGIPGVPIVPPDGSVTNNGGLFFAPGNSFGTPCATFQFVANDSITDSVPATMTINIIASQPPQANTQSATIVSGNSVLLTGAVTPNELDSTAWFEWGTNTAYGYRSVPVILTNGSNPILFTNQIIGLSANFYHYRLVVSNAFATAVGGDRYFAFHKRIWAWGTSIDDTGYKAMYVPAGLSNVEYVAGGPWTLSGLAVKNDGNIAIWMTQTNIPPGLGPVRSLAGGESHFLALQADGTVAGWGYDGYGQTDIPLGLSNVVQIATGRNHSLALTSSGNVVAWGRNTSGQVSVPSGLTNVAAISAGADTSLALKTDGTVVEWGYNDGYPVPANLTNIIAIAGGDIHNVALKGDGTVVAWGDPNNGKTAVPSGLSNVIAIACGGEHSIALKNDGKIVCWGYDVFGQTEPPANLKNVVCIAGGSLHSLALAANETPLAVSQVTASSPNTDLIITLTATDPDADPLSIRVVRLPVIGTLYQYNAGIRGRVSAQTTL